MLAVKGIFYGGVAIGGLAPDIDNTASIAGQRFHSSAMRSIITSGIAP